MKKAPSLITIIIAASIISIFILTACGSTAASSKNMTPLSQIPQNISPSLTYESRDTLSYAQEFAIDRYSDGYTLITISDGSRFLIVPENSPAPTQLSDDITVINQPLDNIYLVASAVMDIFRALDSIDSIRLSGTRSDDWYIDEARAAMESGDILYAGKYSEPDYELILSQGCRLAIENGMITHSPEVGEKLKTLGIPMLIDRSSYEPHPLGRVEWIKLYGALLGREELARQLFDEQQSALNQITQTASGKDAKTVAFFYITANGTVNVRKSADYIPKLIELAGGKYIFDNLGDEESSSFSMTMQMEEFYAAAKDADYLIYNSSIDGELSSIETLLEKSPLLADFKAVQEGKVWCTTKNLYQESMSIGGMITDVNAMLTQDKAAQTKYMYLLE